MKYQLLMLSALVLLGTGCKGESDKSPDDGSGTNPIETCVNDQVSPDLQGTLEVSDNGSKVKSASVSWQEATDDCDMSHYQIAIGTTSGGNDVMDFKTLDKETSFAGEGLSLNASTDYFYTVRAVDGSGNLSVPVSSSAWQIYSVDPVENKTSVTLVASADNLTVDPATERVTKWSDDSGTSVVHDFTPVGVGPKFDGGLSFEEGTFMATPNHVDINLSVVTERTITVSFKTGSDIEARQVIYEEGGQIRGINFVVEEGEFRCGFWNVNDDGEGKRPFSDHSSVVEEDKLYHATFVFDYSDYGQGGTEARVECFVNEQSIGEDTSNTRLHAHSGGIGLGGINGRTYFRDGAPNNVVHTFKGKILSFSLRNKAASAADVARQHRVLDNQLK